MMQEEERLRETRQQSKGQRNQGIVRKPVEPRDRVIGLDEQDDKRVGENDGRLAHHRDP